ncbi:MFS transporter [Thioalkalivibrio sp. HK1]|uniref:MFS transporter n=1 Tax=Thioalkalivibrio sp. HK1 TaxID=1469245 RepID=UPI0009DCD7A9|nr:MFS transporter [Thioalkalivibrio sp. HK1]
MSQSADSLSPPASSSGMSRRALAIIVAACLISLVGFGIRASFGLYLEPMTGDRQWSRETFALAMAIQNLLWGLGVPVAGAIADRFGPTWVIAIGTVVYALGMIGMSMAESGLLMYLTGGLLVGIGVAFTAFSLALAAIARAVGPSKRSLALGLGTAAGSFGQVVFSPISQGLIAGYGWDHALVIVAVISLVMIPLAIVLPRSGGQSSGEAHSDQTLKEALGEAFSHRGYLLLTVGFFVCGFHIAFIVVHFPAYIGDIGLSPMVGAYALALVGLCNIAGSFLSGAIGQKFSKKSALSAIYFARSLVILFLLMAPATETTIYVFSIAMGFLWLSTVPLTSGIVVQVFGIKYMASLFGIVFLSHQLGSFVGVWMGGFIYQQQGSYDQMWWAGIFLGLFAAAVHWPIDEKPLPRLSLAPDAQATGVR